MIDSHCAGAVGRMEPGEYGRPGGSVRCMLNPLRSWMRASPTQQGTRPPARADDLAELTVKDLDGDDVRLGDVWSERPAVLVWLRHYG